MRILKLLCWGSLTVISGLLLATTGTYLYLIQTLPSVDVLKDVKLQVPLQVFTAEGQLIAEYGEMRRTPIAYADIPANFTAAFMAAEDANFKNHIGVDPMGLMRAAFQLIESGHVRSGGSTITMQLAKNFFLSSEQTISRKLVEVMLALQIEHVLTKDEIFDLYLNKIYLGKRAYGIVAAANVYYGKPVAELTLAQVAMIAGLPKAPSRYNPINNPERAKERRDWILGRMYKLGSIDSGQYRSALQEPVDASYHSAEPEIAAPYIAEMARAEVVRQFGDDAYTEGLRVITTVSGSLQTLANSSLQNGLKIYDKRHGYRGAEAHLAGYPSEKWMEELKHHPLLGGLEAVAVTRVSDKNIDVIDATGREESVSWQTMSWARPFISTNALGRQPTNPADIVHVGDVIRIDREPGRLVGFSQVPKAQAALISISPTNGAVQALVGGFDFNQSHFNRVLQAKRQPGSSFKPFIYSAALDSGFTPASIINDSPIVFGDDYSGPKWRPQNDTRTFLGPIRMREALKRSRNMVSIRLLQAMGVDKTINYITRFGFDANDMPRNLSLALGTASITPMEVVAGWSVFANGGYKISPYFIDRIENRSGDVIYAATPRVAPSSINPTPPTLAEQIIDTRTTYLLTSMLQDVIKGGTGRAASKMNRTDIAGKTGTTTDAKDSWFTGYNGDYVTSVWAGFDQPESLGRREWGVTVALPIWVDYMSAALKGKPSYSLPEPEGIVSRMINVEDGTAAAPGSPNTMMEFFKSDNSPPETAKSSENMFEGNTNVTEKTMMDLF